MFHILAGSFRSLSLFLFLFDGTSLRLVDTIQANGPHQYLAYDKPSRAVYMTTWAHPPSLSSWIYENNTLVKTGEVPITATSSYVSIHNHRVYSAGGPAGEVHAVSRENGALGQKIQEFLFVPAEELEKADKTRKALRYGSHAIEIADGRAYVPVLGTDSIEMYTVDDDGTLNHISSNPTIRKGDGPRHLVVKGDKVYVVTEHTNYLDIYSIAGNLLRYVASRSLIPSHLDPARSNYRGDTLVLHGYYLFATTRGGDPLTPGYLSVFRLDGQGLFDGGDEGDYWQTPTSGGKANAISIRPVSNSLDSRVDVDIQQPLQPPLADDAVWILLTDDCAGVPEGEESICGASIRIIEWGAATGFKRVVTEWEGNKMRGASHAVWLD